MRETTTAGPASQAGPAQADLLPAASLLLLAAVAAGAKAQGAFYVPGQLVVGALLLAAAAASLPSRPPRPGLPALVGAALASWCLVSAALHGAVVDGVPPALLVVAVHAALTCARRLDAAQRAALLDGLLLVGAAVALLGVVGVALHSEPLGNADSGVWRAASTLTYENATAGLLAPLALVALGRARTPYARALATVLLAGVAVTGSRGGVLALLVGLVVLGALRRRRPGPALLGPVVGAGVVWLGLLPGLPDPGPARPLPAALGLLLGLGAAAAWAPTRAPRRAVVAAVCAGLVAGAVALPASRAALGDVLDRRVTVGQSDRVGESRAALEAWRGSPLTGVGPGRQPLVWQADGVTKLDRYAHDEWLHVLWKTGAVGLVLLLSWLALLACPCLRGRDPGTAAALACLAVASSLDFLWHLPLIPLVGALLAGVALPHPPLMEDA